MTVLVLDVDPPVVNVPLFRKVLDHIKAEPDSWDQESWVSAAEAGVCGTAYCFAGHALVMTGHELRYLNSGTIELDGVAVYSGSKITGAAAKELGIDREIAVKLFDGENSLEQIERLCAEIVETVGDRL